jgi:hypothetical protein
MRRQRKEWADVSQWLTRKMFHIGATSTGWVAVSRSGIVVIVSDSRMRVTWRKNDGSVGDMWTQVTTMKWIQSVVFLAEGDIYRREEADLQERDELKIRNAMYAGEG